MAIKQSSHWQASVYRNNKRIGIIVKVLFKQLELWKELFEHMNQLENEISYYRKKLKKYPKKRSHFNHIISTSKAMEELKAEAFWQQRIFQRIHHRGKRKRERIICPRDSSGFGEEKETSSKSIVQRFRPTYRNLNYSGMKMGHLQELKKVKTRKI